VVGTRPEIIRLSRVLSVLDEVTDHVVVHTGQNYDYELNEIFFEELGLRRPANRPPRPSATSSPSRTPSSASRSPTRCWCWATPTAP